MNLSQPVFPEGGFLPERSGLPLSTRLARVGRRLFPVKAAQNLAARAGVSHRAARLWFEERTSVGGEALAELLRSDIGLQVLEEVLGERKPRWWPEFRAAVRIKQLEERAEAGRIELAALRQEVDGRTASRRR